MTHQPPSPPAGPQSPRKGMHPLIKFLLIATITVLAIPALAYGLFLAFVLGYAALHGPIRWN